MRTKGGRRRRSIWGKCEGQERPRRETKGKKERGRDEGGTRGGRGRKEGGTRVQSFTIKNGL
jgi:hypothetical protein